MPELSDKHEYVGRDEVNAPRYVAGERPSSYHCPNCDRKVVRLALDLWYCKACAEEYDGKQIGAY